MSHRAATLALVAAMATLSSTASAQSTWTGATGGEWGTASNWTGGVPNAIGAVANINTALTVNISDTGTGGTYPYTFGTLATSLASGSVTIGTNSVTSDILVAATSTGTPTINVANASANIFFYANLQGTQGFTKTGAGKFTFRFNGANQAYSGPIDISAGILGINQAGSLGDSTSIKIGNGARLLAEPGTNSGTITLDNTRAITLAGAQSQIGASNAAVNLVIQGNIGESAAGNGLVKTDAGVVTLTGTLSYTGETRIAGGTLALGGSAALPTGQNLRFNGATGTLDVGSTSQTVRTIVMDNTAGNKTITGAGGSLAVNGDANLLLNASNGVTYSFAGLDTFNFNRAGRDFKVESVNVADVTTITDINLAKGGTGGGANNITANLFQVGGGNSLGNNGNTARLHLGTTNNIYANTFQVGGFNAGGVVDFQAGLTSPNLKLRGTDGASALTTWKIGETSAGLRRGEGGVNLTGGSLDALVTNLTIGRHIAGADLADTSSLTMPAGTLEAQTIILGEKTGTGTPTITASLNQGGGNVKVQTLTFGQDAGGGATANFQTNYNMAGGTLRAQTIQAGAGSFNASSVRRIGWTGGTISNFDGSTDLTINGRGTAAGEFITIAASTTTAKSFAVDAGRTITLGANTTLTAGASNVVVTKSGSGTLVLGGVSTGFGGTFEHSAGTLELGAVDAISTFNAGGFTWNGGSTMNFDLSGLNSSDRISLGAGVFTKGTGTGFTFDFGGGGTAGGIYELSSFGSTTFAQSDFVATNLGAGLVGQFVIDSDSLTLNVSAIPEPASFAALAGLGAISMAGLRRRRRV
jgi:autotransporter-associated beta strand protein